MVDVDGANFVVFPHVATPCAVRVVPIKLFVENAVAMVVSIVVVIRSMSPVP